MRRSAFLIFLVVVGIAVPGALFAASGGPDLIGSILAPPQAWQPQISELGAVSFGVFGTPMDSEFSLVSFDSTAGFGTVMTPAISGGVDNPFGKPAVAGTPGILGANPIPFNLGYYSPGNNPWSVYAYINQTGAPTETANSTVTVPAGYTILPNTYTWVQQQTVSNNMPRPVAAVNNDFIQALYGTQTFQGGVGIKLNIADNANAANNGTAVFTQNYNATPTAAPTQTLDYTITTVTADARDTGGSGNPSTFDIAVGVPLLLKRGSMKHFISVGFEDTAVDASHSQTVTQTDPKDPATVAGFYINSDTNVIAKGSQYQVPLAYALFMPPLIAGNKKNQFVVTADGQVNVATGQFSSVSTSSRFDYLAGGVASTPGVATDTEDTQAYATGLPLIKVGAGAVHSLYFTPAPGVDYGIVPALYLDYARIINGVALTTDTATLRTDVNANGVFTDPVDTTQITTTTYTNAASDTSGITTIDQFEASISVPMVVKIMPQGWPFGFTIGTTPQGWYNFQLATTASRTKSQTVSTQVGTAAPTTATQDFPATDPSTTVAHTWLFQAIHTLGLNFVFGTVTMDVTLNFKTVAGPATISNFFDFNNASASLNVPLTNGQGS